MSELPFLPAFAARQSRRGAHHRAHNKWTQLFFILMKCPGRFLHSWKVSKDSTMMPKRLTAALRQFDPPTSGVGQERRSTQTSRDVRFTVESRRSNSPNAVQIRGNPGHLGRGTVGRLIDLSQDCNRKAGPAYIRKAKDRFFKKMFNEQWSPRMYAHILLSTDGSDLARKGVKHGMDLAKALNAKVTVITVTEPLPVDYGSGHAAGWIPTQEVFDHFDAACKEHAGKILDEAQAMAVQIGISAELLHVPKNAHPATAIIEAAKSRGCDLIVMASHGRRGLSKLFLGSQTSEVLVEGSVPVLVVH